MICLEVYWYKYLIIFCLTREDKRGLEEFEGIRDLWKAALEPEIIFFNIPALNKRSYL